MSELKSDDFLLVNREGVDYKITLESLAEYLQVEPVPEPEPIPIYSTSLTTPSASKKNCKMGEWVGGTTAGWTTEVTTASTEPPTFYYRIMKNCRPGNNAWNDYEPASDWIEYDGTVQEIGNIVRVGADWKAYYIEDKAVCGDEVQQLRSNWHEYICWPCNITPGVITDKGIGNFTADDVKLPEFHVDNPHTQGWARWHFQCNGQRMNDGESYQNGEEPTAMIAFLNGMEINRTVIKAGDVVTAEGVYEYVGHQGCTENVPGFGAPYTDSNCTVTATGEVPPPPMPWDNHDGCIFHVYVERQESLAGTGKVEKLMLSTTAQPTWTAWDKNGNNERQISEINAEEEVVFITPANAEWIFNKSNLDCKFKFLEKTDVSKATSLKGLLSMCMCFNDESLSDWDVSNVSNMQYMFDNARAFNQDLSNWCVEKIADEPQFSDDSGLAEANKPKWGTCPSKPKPWEDHVASGGVILHVKDATGTVNFEKSNVYEIDGTHKGEINSFGPGEEVVILTDPELSNFFSHSNNNTQNWNFGELTDVSNALAFVRMFSECSAFNGTGMGEWDTSSAEYMGHMFNNCAVFNQNLSKWCVIDPVHNGFDKGADSWQDDFKPVWGTCPGNGMPWDGHDGGVFHVKNATGEVTLLEICKAYDTNGNSLGEIRSFGPGEELVFLSRNDCNNLFYRNNSDKAWEFGHLTNTTHVIVMRAMFENCRVFNSDISDWDVSNVHNMNNMFESCEFFNQDLSKWCVPTVEHRNFDEGAGSWESKNKPKWGTCP